MEKDLRDKLSNLPQNKQVGCLWYLIGYMDGWEADFFTGLQEAIIDGEKPDSLGDWVDEEIYREGEREKEFKGVKS